MANAYATTNALAALSASAYTWSNAYAGSDRALVNDGRMDKQVNVGSPTTSINVIIDLGSAVALAGFALLNTNLVPAIGTITCTIESADNSGMSTNLATLKATSTLASYFSNSSREPRNKDHALAFVAGTPRRYWRLSFAWTGTLSNFSIGELFAWTSATTLTRNPVYGVGDGEEILSTQLKTLSGDTRSSFIAGPVRNKKLPWADLTATQRDQLRSLHRAALGTVSPFLWFESYSAAQTAAAAADQDCIYGRLDTGEFSFVENDYQLFQPPEMHIVSLGREVGS